MTPNCPDDQSWLEPHQTSVSLIIALDKERAGAKADLQLVFSAAIIFDKLIYSI